MDKQEVRTELRRQHDQAELVSVDARARIREAEQLVAARELVGALESVVDSRLGPVADQVRLELLDALAQEAARAREQVARGQASLQEEIDRAHGEAAERLDGHARQFRRQAEEERAAIEERLSTLVDDRVGDAARELADQTARLHDEIEPRVQSSLEERFAAEADRFSAELEDRVRERTSELRAELEQRETERAEHLRTLAAEQSEAAAEHLRREADRARAEAAGELDKRVGEFQKDAKRQRGKLEDRVSGRIGKRIEAAVERQVRAAVGELAEEQRRQRGRDLEALSKALREEFETRLQALEQRSQPGPGRRW